MDVASLKVADLKKELAARDLNTNGLKAELAARLQEHLDAEGKKNDHEENGVEPEKVDVPEAEGETEVDLGIEKDQSPVETREASDAVEADAIADEVRAVEEADDNKDSREEPSTLGAIHDAHAAGVEAVQVDAVADGAGAVAVADAEIDNAKSPSIAAVIESSPSPTIPKAAKPLSKVEPAHPPTRALKVLRLVRPILATTLREEAEKFGQLEEGQEFRQGIFLDGIKSAGWIVYKDTASATALVDAFNGKPFPTTDAFRGSVWFYYVPPEVVPGFISQEEELWEKEQGRLQILADVIPAEGDDNAVTPKYEYFSRPLKKALGKKDKSTDDSTTTTTTKKNVNKEKAKVNPALAAAAGIPPRPSSRIRGLASANLSDASHLPPVVFPPAREVPPATRYHPYNRGPREDFSYSRRGASPPPTTAQIYAKDIDYPIHPRTGGNTSYSRESERDRRSAVVVPPPPQTSRGYDDYEYSARSAYRHGGGYENRRPAPRDVRDYDRPPRDTAGGSGGPARYPPSSAYDREYVGAPRGGYDAGYDRRDRDRSRQYDYDRSRDRQRSPVSQSYSRSRDDRYERRPPFHTSH